MATKKGEPKPGNLDELVVFCASEIIHRKETCTFERITVECFRRFPAEFSLRGYPEFPDSARVNKCWLRCRTDRGWLIGNVQAGFRLSAVGERVARDIAQRVLNPTLRRDVRVGSRSRSRQEGLLKHLRESSSYRRYKEQRLEFRPTENELRSLALSTLDTPWRVVRQNLNQLLAETRSASASDAEAFLILCMKSFRSVSSEAEKIVEA